MTRDQTFVIVGGGMAGAKAAETLRDEGFAGHIVLIGAEDERPYERPPLSKEYLRGEAGRDALFVHDAGFYAARDVDLELGRRAIALDPAADELVLDDGVRLRYDCLLLATGSEPRRLPIPGAELDGVHYLRTAADSDALRRRLGDARAVVVVGAGWIGCEVAASARQLGLDVTLIARAAVPLERALGPRFGAVYRDVHADHGVRLLLGADLESFEGHGAVERVRTADGRAIECDLVVVGVGAQPRVELAAGGGLDVDDGVVADACLQSSRPGVFVAGDIASARHPFYGRPLRVEHWANALEQGPAAARNMLGRAIAYDRLPYFFSDQYDVGMEYTGHAAGADRVVVRGDVASREFIAFWLAGDRVLAGMNVGVWDVADAIGDLIRGRERIDERRLADPDVPLAQLRARSARAAPSRAR